MEADLFQEIFDAVQNHKQRISLPLANECPIQKVVWSSFDYMRGSELEFVWEANYLEEVVAEKLSNQQNATNTAAIGAYDNETSEGTATNSTDSSFSKNTEQSAASQYEEIEAYNSEHLQLEAEFCDRPISDWPLQESFQESTTDCSTSKTLLVRDEGCSLNSSFLTEEAGPSVQQTLSRSKESLHQKETNLMGVAELGEKEAAAEETMMAEHLTPEPNTSETMVTSCVDSGIGCTISIDSNLSAYAAKAEPKDEEVIYNVEKQRCHIKLNREDRMIPEAEEVIEFKRAYDAESGSEVGSQRNAHNQCSSPSPLTNSQIAQSSMHSSFFSSPQHNSTTNNNNNGEEEQQSMDREKSIFYKEAELLATELAPSDPFGNGVPDEVFISKHVLAEQIGSTQLSTNPILHKFCILPSRYITVGSYIFSTRKGSEHQLVAANAISAFSLILPLNKANWFLQRQHVFMEMFTDIIARFKAAFLVERIDDLVCRCTREFIEVFSLFGALQRWPLAPRELTQLKIQSSHLWELNKMPNEFVARCITACLICRGRCTILGSNPKEVVRLMQTLSAFLDPSDRIFCLRPFKMQFNEYLRLQAIKRPEVNRYFERASNAHWSSALLDIDRRSVSYTGLYHNKHRRQKLRTQKFQIVQIFREAANSGLKVPASILAELEQHASNARNELETQFVPAEPSIKEFLDQMALMPLNRAARLSFVDHFHLRLENRAKALIAYVRDLSAPAPGDKRSALSSKWRLATVRRNLNLLSDAAFGIAFARADGIQPEFAEFIAQQTTSAGRFIHQ